MSERTVTRSVEDKLVLLGYPPDAKLLIINGDDLGVCHAANVGTFEAMDRGIMTAASLMIPCPWAYDACMYLRLHPGLDVGVHLTFTSEWERYRWGPVLGADRCPSLVDRWGFFYPTEDELYAHGNADEILMEAEAQIRRAHDWGLDPANLDGHMGTLYAHPPYLALYLELARRHRLPLRLPPRRMYEEEGMASIYDALSLEGLISNDDLRFINLDNPPALRDQLFETLQALQPGITELCLHATVETPEAQAVMSDWPARVEALNLVTDDEVRGEIEQLGIVLIGWRALRDALRRSA